MENCSRSALRYRRARCIGYAAAVARICDVYFNIYVQSYSSFETRYPQTDFLALKEYQVLFNKQLVYSGKYELPTRPTALPAVPSIFDVLLLVLTALKAIQNPAPL